MKAILLQKELSDFLKLNGIESFSKLVFDSIVYSGGNANTIKNFVKKISAHGEITNENINNIENVLSDGCSIINWNGDTLSLCADQLYEAEINFNSKPTKKYKKLKTAIKIFLNEEA